MDASNEFQFISGPEELRNKPIPNINNNGTLRSVPICVENTNRNLKLRFVWDKAFKLFQSQKTVYRAVSGIEYNDYGTGTGTSHRNKRKIGSGGRSEVQRSQSQSDIMSATNNETCPMKCPTCHLPQTVRQVSPYYEPLTRRSPLTRKKRTSLRSATSGIKTPENNGSISTGNVIPTDTEDMMMSFRLHPLSSSSSKTVPPSDVNRTPSTNKRTHHYRNCGCKDATLPLLVVDGHDGGGREPLKRDSHNPFKNVSLRRSQSQKHPRRPSTFEFNKSVPQIVPPGQHNIGSIERPETPIEYLKRKLAGTASSIFAHSPSPDSIYGHDDSGLDTWKSPPPHSIVCTISSNDRSGTVISSDLRLRENVEHYSDICDEKGMNTSIIQIGKSRESVSSSELDIDSLSEIDLNSSSSESEDIPRGQIQESNMKLTDGTSQVTDFGNSRSNIQRPFNSSLYPPENELDSLDLTLFESGQMESYKSPIQTGSESRDLGVYESLSNQSTTTTLRSEHGSCSNQNWSDAGSEFEFMASPMWQNSNRDIPLGHSSRSHPPEVEWEPYFCVLNQLDQTFTSYRSEEMSIFPGTPTRPRSTNSALTGEGISPADVVRIRLDGSPNSVKCLINNSKWGMNPVLEEEEENTNKMHLCNNSTSYDYSSTSSSQRNSSPASTVHDTGIDKANDAGRRSSAPLTPVLGREASSSRLANFFAKRSFKGIPLKRTKSATKLERKKTTTGSENESSIFPSRLLRTSRSHESLLTWTTHSVQNFIANGMMSTLDLGAGDVSIRPLHPSVLGQEFGFQIVTQSSGSKYYSCSSLAERDAWVQAMRQAIKPYADEVRRLEDSLKIWILEGKGIPNTGKQSSSSTFSSSSKRYFCELYIDDVLYGRTSSKPKGEMLFWGEHFEFSQLPNCSQLITVAFFREGDKKRKKERNTCIGKVKIPVNAVNSRYLIEKWYPVLAESSSSKDKEKETKGGPSIRIKCKFQSVDILPLRSYTTFLQYIKDEYGPVCECLENVLSVKAKEDLATAMVHVLHHEGLAKEFIAELALQEILKSGDEKLTFRGNSIATKAMEAYLKLTGSEYLLETLETFVENFQNSEASLDCEVDPMKLSSFTNSTLTKNQQNLRLTIETVWKSILNSHSNFPIELRECFTHCREALKSAGRDELGDHLISASIFLRFICPAILSPSLFNITNEYPSEKSARNLTLVAKVIQTLANFTKFQGKETYMEFLNDFVEKEAENMKNFLALISSPVKEIPEDTVIQNSPLGETKKPKCGCGFIDLGKYLSILSTLLIESVGKIVSKNERFKKLQDLLDSIHWALKQPRNATNVTVLPFPQLESSPLSSVPLSGKAGVFPRSSNRNSAPIISMNGNNQFQFTDGILSPSFTSSTASPIYAVTNVNPNVKNISHVQVIGNGPGVGGFPVPLQLHIPTTSGPLQPISSVHPGLRNQRSGSQASSGYQSQSPVLEGDKSKNNSPQIISNLVGKDTQNLEIGTISGSTGRRKLHTPLNSNKLTNHKSGSLSVDDLSSIGILDIPHPKGINKNDFKKRLTRSSSSSECEYATTGSTVASTKTKARLSKSNRPQNRLTRRSSAEVLKKSHPFTSSSDEDSDSGLVNDKEMDSMPKVLHRRGQGGQKYVPVTRHSDGILDDVRLSKLQYGINPHEYEREMLELRSAMEALQMKLNRAEERLFGHDLSPRSRDSILPVNVDQLCLDPEIVNLGTHGGVVDEKEMEELLHRFLSAEEEMKREQELLVALDEKQKLIEAQEEKISRLDAVNNQLLNALSQIRDSLNQQQLQQQHLRLQQQLLLQQQYLQSITNNTTVPVTYGQETSQMTSNFINNNTVTVDGASPGCTVRSRNYQTQLSPNGNTTKILINSSSDHHSTTEGFSSTSSGSVSPDSLDSRNQNYSASNRDTCAILEEETLRKLAELKTSSC